MTTDQALSESFEQFAVDHAEKQSGSTSASLQTPTHQPSPPEGSTIGDCRRLMRHKCQPVRLTNRQREDIRRAFEEHRLSWDVSFQVVVGDNLPQSLKGHGRVLKVHDSVAVRAKRDQIIDLG